MQSACLRPVAVSLHERSGTVTLSCVYSELSPCSPALIITFASDSPCRITYKSRGIPIFAYSFAFIHILRAFLVLPFIRPARIIIECFHRSRFERMPHAKPRRFHDWHTRSSRCRHVRFTASPSTRRGATTPARCRSVSTWHGIPPVSCRYVF